MKHKGNGRGNPLNKNNSTSPDNSGRKKENIWKDKLLSQQEVANHFRASSNTIKNWRKRGLLSYFQAPGSTRKLYYEDEIKNFKIANTVFNKSYLKNVVDKKKKGKPVISPNSKNEDWRI